MSSPFLWYRDKQSLRIGGVSRYTIEYTRTDPERSHIYFRLKNIEKTSIRAIHLLNGPFILYCHVVPHNYSHRKKFNPADSTDNREVLFENQIKPGQTFNVKLELNDNSYVKETSDNESVFSWQIDIVSQIVITRNTSILYDFMIGDDLESMRSLNTRSFSSANQEWLGSSRLNPEKLGEPTNPQLHVQKELVEDLWATRPKYPDRPIHLVIITHGIFSNLTADMLYLKDVLEESVDDNIIVKGFKGNAGKTERGVKKLGTAVSDYIVDLIETISEHYTIDRISFIGHSLGGPVQLYAIKNILLTKGTGYFKERNIQPFNLIFMASPLLGVLSEMSILISWFLDLGTLGKTGRDLTLLKRLPNINQVKLNSNNDLKQRDNFKPLLETLPDEPLRSFLAEFKHLTVYANAVNDGIVPLRTSALLYLDYEALGDITQIKKNRKVSQLDHDGHHDGHQDEASIATDAAESTVGEASDSNQQHKKSVTKKYWEFFWLNFSGPFEKTPNKSNAKHHDPDVKKKLTRREKKFLRITAKGSDYYNLFNKTDSTSDNEDEDDDQSNDSANDSYDSTTSPSLNIPPKASAIESAINTVLCPTPSNNFIMDPDSRSPVIFHDKYYHFDNLPASVKEEEHHHPKQFLFRYSDWKLHKQVKIAKKYHQPNLNWRKVLVRLPPDAHNNIVVRRRFANGFGWGVVDHVCGLFSETPPEHPSESEPQDLGKKNSASSGSLRAKI